MIDAHLHLQDERLQEWGVTDDLVAQCRQLGITAQLVNGTRPEDWEGVAQLAERFPEQVFPNYGLHPWYVQDVGEGWQAQLRQCLDDERTVGVGEIGLDKWIRNHDLVKQKEAFRFQLALACERNLPASIHCLRAWGHLLEILQEEATPRCGFLLHSYGGPEEMVEAFVNLGAYFSVSGYFFRQKKHAALETLLRRVPRERLLVETDAPDMNLPRERQRFVSSSVNHPGNLAAVYVSVAEWLGETVDSLSEQMRENAGRLFGIHVEP